MVNKDRYLPFKEGAFFYNFLHIWEAAENNYLTFTWEDYFYLHKL